LVVNQLILACLSGVLNPGPERFFSFQQRLKSLP